MAAKLTLTQHLANTTASCAAKGLSQEETSRCLVEAKDRWESRLNTPTGVPQG